MKIIGWHEKYDPQQYTGSVLHIIIGLSEDEYALDVINGVRELIKKLDPENDQTLYPEKEMNIEIINKDGEHIPCGKYIPSDK